MTDLRKDATEVRIPPLTWTTCLIIAGLLSATGIVMAFIGQFAGAGSEDEAPVMDVRPYILLSTTVDLVHGAGNVSYQDLQVSMLLYLVLTGKAEWDLNLTSEVQSRALFLYPGADSVVLTASIDGAGERSIFGSEGVGSPSASVASVPVHDVSLSIVLLTWGSNE
jgi:hypothetical protein